MENIINKELEENSLQTIVREAKEELNIDIVASNLKLLTKFKTGNVWQEYI